MSNLFYSFILLFFYSFILLFFYSFISVAKTQIVESNDFDFSMRTLKLNNFTGSGGAILPLTPPFILYATSDGKFIKLNINSGKIEHFLSSLDLGIQRFANSKNYTIKETPPRVHDVIKIKNEFYASYDYYDEKTDRTDFRISKFNKQWKLVFKSIPLESSLFTWGSGGKLAYNAAENALYFSIGDFSLDAENNRSTSLAAQNPSLPWGKILKLSISENIYQVFSIGHRNPQGLTFTNTGELVESEHGPQGGDEINIIEKGKNYGWPYISFGKIYGSHEEYSSRYHNKPGLNNFTDPIFAYVPSVATSSIREIQNFDEKWDNDLLLASLKATSLFHLKYKNRRIIFSEQIDLGHRIRDVQIFDNKIICLTDEPQILVLEKMNVPTKNPPPKLKDKFINKIKKIFSN